ncbi:hypothetical protein ABEZ59_00510 [Peribacillus simplex]
MVIYGLLEILLTINAIAPGPVNTELFNVGKSEQQIEGMKKMNAKKFIRMIDTLFDAHPHFPLIILRDNIVRLCDIRIFGILTKIRAISIIINNNIHE